MKLLTLFTLPILAYGQAVITNGPLWDATQTTIRVRASTDVVVVPRLKWGIGSPTNTANFAQSGSPNSAASDIVAVTLTGLTPGTAYAVQFCGVITGPIETCSSTITMTTTAGALAETDVATLPTEVTVPITPPSVANTSYVGADCLAAGTGLQALLDTVPFGDAIEIPRTTTNCWGQFNYNKSTVSTTSFITIKGDQTATELPPAGSGMIEAVVDMDAPTVTTTNRFESTMPTIWHVAPNYYYNGAKVADAPCSYAAAEAPGQIVSPFGASFAMWKCSFGSTTRTITAATTASPIVITATAHGYSEGNIVSITGVVGMTKLNTYWVVVSPTANTFALRQIGCSNPFECAVSNGAGQTYTSGGTIRRFEWQLAPFTSGTVNPSGSCTAGAWYVNTAAGGTWHDNQTWRCVQDNRWVRWVIQNQAGNIGGFEIMENASNLYITGVRFKAMPIPEEPEWTAQPITGFTPVNGAALLTMVKARYNSKRIVLDRVVIDGSIDDNTRTITGFNPEGANVALVNSVVKGLGVWEPSYTLGAQVYGPNNNLSSTAIQISCGPGPGLFQNNYLEVYGITTYIDDGCQASTATPPTDYVFRRNLLHRNDKYWEGSATWSTNAAALKRRWNVRQMYEQKTGHRILYEGNRTVGGWADGTNSACAFAFTAYNSAGVPFSQAAGTATVNAIHLRAVSGLQLNDTLWVYYGNSATNGWKTVTSVAGLPNTFGITDSGTYGTIDFGKLNTLQSIRDVTIRHSTFANHGCGVQFWGLNLQQPKHAKSSGRLMIENNLFYKMEGTRGTPGSGFASPTSGSASYDLRLDAGVEIAAFRHNTSLGRTNQPGPIGGMYQIDSQNHPGPAQSNGFWFRDNLSTYGTYGVDRSNAAPGTASMTAEWANYTWSRNVIIRAAGDPGSFPASSSWPTSETNAGYASPASLNNYALLPSSSYQSGGAGKASDGLAIGADMDALDAAQGRVSNVRTIAVGNTTATIGFFAPDTATCAVDWNATSTPTVVTRVTSAATNGLPPRSQTAALTGLAANTAHQYRVICAAAIVSGTLTTAP